MKACVRIAFYANAMVLIIDKTGRTEWGIPCLLLRAMRFSSINLLRRYSKRHFIGYNFSPPTLFAPTNGLRNLWG